MPRRWNNDRWQERDLERWENQQRQRAEEEAEMGEINWSNNRDNNQPNQWPIPNEGFLNVPEGSKNAITFNDIENGNTLINFRRNQPNTFESKFGRYYKNSTVSQLTTHPAARGPIINRKRYTASIIPTLKNNNEGYNANNEGNNRKSRRRAASRKLRKSRRKNRKESRRRR
jgi:hypothetical protein